MKDELKQPMMAALKMTDEEYKRADFHDFNYYADTIRAMRFEGVEFNDTFTFEQWLHALQVQKIYLSERFTKDTRDLMLSRIMR